MFPYFKGLKILLTLLFSVVFLFSNAQKTVVLTGVVKDDLNQFLSNTNILAYPELDKESIRFSISNQRGEYSLKLKKGILYNLEISYLGFESLKFSITLDKNRTKDIALSPSVNELDEVILDYTIPIVVKKDTIIYDTDAFVSGKERKLREVLKKLPGIEVDRDGNVTAQGKKITKVMVEGNLFFTGNSKLAVNNIPADAVDKIEILDNYSKVGFLKGLENSDDIAMNILLEKNKKKFTFGDIELGAGAKKRYLIHPTLFYYSPKTTINFIGDINNTGKKSFDLSDYIQFEGGYKKLASNMNNFFELFNNDFSKYLANKDFKKNTYKFTALNLRQSLSNKTDLNTYVIVNSNTSETEGHTLNEYVNTINPFVENRTTANTLKNFFVIGKITFDYELSSKEDFSSNAFVKFTNNNTKGALLTRSPQQNIDFNTISELNSVNLKQNIEYSKNFSRSQTLRTEASIAYVKNTPTNTWVTNQPFLDNLIPLQSDTTFDIFQHKSVNNTTIDFMIKDYWVLNNTNHIYTTLGANLVFEEYTTNEEQRLSNGTINSFSDSGFGNNISYQLNDFFLGLEYKFLVGVFTIKPAVYLHNYSWNFTQFEDYFKNSTNAVLPQLTAEVKLSSSEEINFKYDSNLYFPNSSKLTRNFILTNFNRVYLGNESLSYEKYHSYSLKYDKFRVFRGLNLNARVSFKRKTQSIKSTTELKGINQFSTLTMLVMPENNLSGKFSFSKKINQIKYGLATSGTYNEFFQIVNSKTSKNISKTLSVTGKIETFFKKFPNLELGYTYSPSIYTTNFSNYLFKNNEFFVNLDYVFLKDFTLKADYSGFNYQNEDAGIENISDIANASIFYQKEDSSWVFEFEATNLFNIQFKQENYFSDFLISNQSTFVLPRILMFKLSYKL